MPDVLDAQSRACREYWRRRALRENVGNLLFQGRPVELNSANFEEHATSSDIRFFLIDFWAEWRGPCRQMSPGFAAAAAKVEDTYGLVSWTPKPSRRCPRVYHSEHPQPRSCRGGAADRADRWCEARKRASSMDRGRDGVTPSPFPTSLHQRHVLSRVFLP